MSKALQVQFSVRTATRRCGRCIHERHNHCTGRLITNKDSLCHCHCRYKPRTVISV